MRAARAIPVVLALALAPAGASAEPPPRVSVRLDYTRGKGGAACPADPTALRAEVEHVMGYDPFEPSAPERLVVLVSSKDGAFAALVERFNAAGVTTWSETFGQKKPTPGNCTALFPPLASYLDGLFLTYQGAPAPRPALPSEPAVPVPTPPPAAPPELRAPLPKSAEQPDVPNPTRTLASRVMIASYVTAGAFLTLAIGFTANEQSKKNAAQTLAAQPAPAGGTGNTACYQGPTLDSYCTRLLKVWQAHDEAVGLRNGAFAAAGVSAAIGVAATVWAVNLPTTIRGQAPTQVMIRPGGVVLSGTF